MEPNLSLSSNSQPDCLGDVKTIEPYLSEAAVLVSQLRNSLQRPVNHRLRRVFSALAGGDEAIGLLAFYLWRRQGRRYR